ncbi:carbonic anhydrase [Xylogone sp. PMI_703]|nr:carbonic anhydrase [Xylogone sp. PMI_703]
MAPPTGHPEVNPYRPFDFQAANKKYVENKFSEPDMMVGARSRVGIITCCDARCSPDQFFDLEPNEAFVIRNGGGRTATDDVIRTLAMIEVLSDIKELMVIHHTDCGAIVGREDWIRQMIAENDPKAKGGPFREGAAAWAESLAMLPFDIKEGETEREIVDRSVVQDVKFLRAHPLIKPSIPVTGWVYNLHNGKVEPVEC